MTRFSRTTFQPVELEVAAKVQSDVSAATTPTPPLQQRFSGFSTPDYLIVGGIPVAPPSASVIVPTSAGLSEVTTTIDAPTPESVQTTAVARWLPHKGFTTDRGRWDPYQGDNRLWWNPTTPLRSPSRVKLDYAYEGAQQAPRQAPALEFNQDGYLALHGAGANGPFGADTMQGTVALIACMQGATNAYGVATSNQEAKSAGTGSAFSLTYNKGRWEVRAGGRLTAYESSANPFRPMIVVLSLNVGGFKEGRICVLDGDRKYTSQFSTAGMNAIDFDLFLGASMHLISQYDPDKAANMDVLEIALWTSALNQRQMDFYINRVAPAYGLVS